MERAAIVVMNVHLPPIPKLNQTNRSHWILTVLSRPVQQTPSWASDDPHVTAQSEALRVLVVDDEPSIVDVVAMALRHHGYDVATVDTGAGALAQVRDWHPHAIVLDVMLPDMEGFEVARRLSAQRAAVPILFLSARDNTSDKIRGLTTGGDDYVTKPFSLEELMARLRNILRRSGAHQERSSRLVFADLELDDDTREVSRGGSPIELTATEYRLLRYLLLNPRRVMTRAQLLDHVWSYDFGGDARVLETYISYLRKKLDVGGPPLLHTIRGVGYVLRLPRE
jgi:two-component system OmpR family response regulator